LGFCSRLRRNPRRKTCFLNSSGRKAQRLPRKDFEPPREGRRRRFFVVGVSAAAAGQQQPPHLRTGVESTFTAAAGLFDGRRASAIVLLSGVPDTMKASARRHRAKRIRERPRASGRFVLRIEPALHEALRTAARECGLSLNDYCSRKVAAPANGCDLDDAAHAVRQATALFGDTLIGLIVFGSWVRGEAAATSDVDLLIVLDSRVALTRNLYRRWDGAPVAWDGRVVEPHFVHLPDPGAVTGGVWAEAAMDGVVLFERALRVSRRLALVRRHILSGRLVRRLVHGQPYWTEVA
jgi:hypothetical protein